jgi:hypothetical protein
MVGLADPKLIGICGDYVTFMGLFEDPGCCACGFDYVGAAAF